MSRGFVIFSGYNQRAVVCLCRVLSYYRLPFYILARDSSDSIFLSDFAPHVLAARTSMALDFKEISAMLFRVRAEKKIDEILLCPTTEALNRFFLRNRTALKELGCHIPLVEEATYHTISDKYEFGQLCAGREIAVPNEVSLSHAPPFVIKPKSYFAGNGEVFTPHLVFSQSDLPQAKRMIDIGNYYVQEFVEGESLYLLYYFAADGRVAAISQKNLMQQSQGKSIIAAEISDIHEQPISDRFVELFKSLNFRGFVMVEIKRSADRDYMIEANPRLWGPSQLLMDSGSGLFELFLEDYGYGDQIHSIGRLPKSSDKYFWFGGCVHRLEKDVDLAFHGWSKTQLIDSLSSWLQSDVYLRADTLKMFYKEVQPTRSP